MNEKTYQFPNDLSQKPMMGVWTIPGLAVTATAAVICLVLALNAKSFIPLAPAIVIGLMLAHFDERSAFDHFASWAKFLYEPQVWEYMPKRAGSTVVSNKPEKKRKANKNMVGLIAALVLLVFFAGFLLYAKAKGMLN